MDKCSFHKQTKYFPHTHRLGKDPVHASSVEDSTGFWYFFSLWGVGTPPSGDTSIPIDSGEIFVGAVGEAANTKPF